MESDVVEFKLGASQQATGIVLFMLVIPLAVGMVWMLAFVLVGAALGGRYVEDTAFSIAALVAALPALWVGYQLLRHYWKRASGKVQVTAEGVISTVEGGECELRFDELRDVWYCPPYDDTAESAKLMLAPESGKVVTISKLSSTKELFELISERAMPVIVARRQAALDRGESFEVTWPVPWMPLWIGLACLAGCLAIPVVQYGEGLSLGRIDEIAGALVVALMLGAFAFWQLRRFAIGLSSRLMVSELGLTRQRDGYELRWDEMAAVEEGIEQITFVGDFETIIIPRDGPGAEVLLRLARERVDAA